MKILKTIIPNIAAIASIIALFFIDVELTPLRIVSAIVGVLLLIFVIIYTIHEHKKEEPIVLRNHNDVNNYLHKLIKTQGVIHIFSRDLSWVTPDIKETMKKKSSDLYVCVKKEISLTTELKENGANVYYYGDLEYEPESRFTIIRANKSEKQVAIATTKSENNKDNDILEHKIYLTKENDYKDNWIKILSSDLFKAAQTLNVYHKENTND
jgi:hypothetical protein